MPSMNDSSEPVDTSSTRTLAVGCSASRRASSSSATTPVDVVVGARHHLRRADLPDHGRGARRDDAAGDPGRAGCRRASRARPAPGRRRRGTSAAGWCRCARSAPGTAATRRPGSPGWKIRPDLAASWWATSTTVRRASCGPHLRDDVEGVALGQQPARVVRAAGDVVPDARGCGAGERARRPTPAAAAGQRAQRAREAQQRRAAPSSRRAHARSRSARGRRARASGPRPTRRPAARPPTPRAGGSPPAR